MALLHPLHTLSAVLLRTLHTLPVALLLHTLPATLLLHTLPAALLLHTLPAALLCTLLPRAPPGAMRQLAPRCPPAVFQWICRETLLQRWPRHRRRGTMIGRTILQ